MPLGGALILGGSSLLGGLFSGFGAQAGASQQAAAMRYAADLQHQQYEQNAATLSPYINQGASASQLLGNYLGVNGVGAQGTAMANYQTSPFFNQMVKTAGANTANQYGAMGQTGGNLLNALYNQNAGLWNTQYNTTLQQLAGLSGQGLSGASALAGSGTQLANQQGQLLAGAGAAQGAGTMGMWGGLGGGISNAGLFGLLGYNNYNNPNAGLPESYNTPDFA